MLLGIFQWLPGKHLLRSGVLVADGFSRGCSKPGFMNHLLTVKPRLGRGRGNRSDVRRFDASLLARRSTGWLIGGFFGLIYVHRDQMLQGTAPALG